MLTALKDIITKSWRPPAYGNNRAHDRYPIWETRFCHVWINDQVKAEPLNLSYGGAKLKILSPANERFENLPEDVKLRIHILDQDLVVDAKKTHIEGNVGGLRFLRDSSEVLELLDTVLDGMRIGSSLWGVSTRTISSGTTELLLEGIEETRLSMTLGPDNLQVPSFRLNYPKAGWNYEVSIVDSKLSTATFSKPALRMIKTETPPRLIEAQVVRQAFFIMMGVSDPALRQQLDRPIRMCLEALGQPAE